MVVSPVADLPYPGLPQNTAEDRERARELYKYFRPPLAGEPLDTVLTAHAQLAAWRLDAERAMISLIDENDQYFVAESTKTSYLDDAELHEKPGDGIWAGCVKVTKAGRLCEHTIAAHPPAEGGPPLFEVLDLSKDCRFNKLDFVTGAPSFRTYSGVPLRTSRGINIGSIYILDSRVRPPLTCIEKQFLGVMADNVIQHLEMSKDKKDRQRTFKMNECLSAYVDPSLESTRHETRNSQNSCSTDADSNADPKPTTDGFERLDVFTRATDLLLASMDLEDDGGGVVFVDTLAVVPQQTPSPEKSGKTTAPGTRSSSRDTHKPHINTTEILAHAYQSATKLPDSQNFIPFTPEELSKLAKHYPRGNLFTFEQLGQGYSDSSDDEGKLAESARNGKLQRSATAKPGMKRLQKHFPNARQIIFLPLWDSTTARSTACFVYNSSDYRNFTHQLEFLHCITFSNCIDTDLMRLANLKEIEQKSDFIGSISHELRSPLHGILASCEFLQDTECTSFQQSLVNTANSCARTLLDTVNMVLDYSKINAFEKSTGKTNSVSSTDPTTDSEFLQANLSTSRHVDLAILTEEVVEGVATGYAYNDSLKRTDGENFQVGAQGRRPSSPSNFAPCKPDVELIVDIPERDWTYWTEPGELRRIIMNLVGNSLKYTKAGYVHIELATQDIDPATPSSEYVVLTVTDSGQGMSPAYLKDKLFKPFAQESNQTPGVGLGLSLVKSIVSKIGGHIDVESTVGVGTKVTVKFSLPRATKADPRIDSAVNSASSTDSAYSAADSSMRLLKTQAVGKTVALYLPENEHPGSDQQEAFRLMHKILTAYLRTWCGFTVTQWHDSSTADVVVTEEVNLDALLRDSPQLSAHGCNTMVLVLRNTPSTQPLKTGSVSSNRIEDIRHPFGPHKLARALCICLDRFRSIDTATKVADGTVASTKLLVDSITHAAAKIDVSGLESTPEEHFIVANENAKPHEGTVQEVIDASANQETESSKIIYESQVLVHTKAVDALELKSAVVSTHSVSQVTQLTRSVGDQGLTPSNAELGAGLQKSATITESPKRKLRALLVDDNTINLRLLQVGMKKRGYTAISNAENGLQAVNTFRDLLYASPSTPPDVVLMDLSMPVMNGFDATRKIREIEAEFNSKLPPSHAPQHSLIIALTGLASIRDQKEAFTSGVDSYIMKPVKFARLTELLEDWTVGMEK
ncbi:hypothetical protein N0V94_001458 [Neodidymelliopsis sp. IMI 364377]|nr:hypothetical protein N0V94_001458 [Neodidymelliopsis sp. IMI 364377]